MRHRILVAFERAEDSRDEAERRRLLTFVVVGGGPTGVELAGALAELAEGGAGTRLPAHRSDDRAHRSGRTGDRLLPSFPPKLSAIAASALTGLGVELRLGTPVTSCDPDGVTIGGERIDSRPVLWAAGVAASPAAAWLGVVPARGGRVPVGPDLTLPGHPEIFVIGDTAGVQGRPLPGIAPVAKQQGAYAARVVIARLAGKPPPPAFRYRNYGNLATIGRSHAVVDFGWLKLSGRIAWLVWGVAHILFLIGFRNRLAVAIEWLWSYLTCPARRPPDHRPGDLERYPIESDRKSQPPPARCARHLPRVAGEEP